MIKKLGANKIFYCKMGLFSTALIILTLGFGNLAYADKLDFNGKKLFVTFSTTASIKNKWTYSGRKPIIDNIRVPSKHAILLRLVNGALYVVEPDNQANTVFVGGKSITSSGASAGNGKNVCIKNTLEDGLKRKMCAKYSYKRNTISVSIDTFHTSENGKGRETYKIYYDGKSCKFLSYSNKGLLKDAYDDAWPDPNTQAKKYTVSFGAKSKSGKCAIK